MRFFRMRSRTPVASERIRLTIFVGPRTAALPGLGFPVRRAETDRALDSLEVEPVRVDDVLRDGDEFTWGPATIRAIATPGHTDG